MKLFGIAIFFVHVVACVALLAKRVENTTQPHGSLKIIDFKRYAGSPVNAKILNADLNAAYKWKKYSQGMQDSIIHNVFEAVGMTNKYYVEFGFNSGGFGIKDDSGPNTELLHEHGWQGLLMDGGHENKEVNLHKEWITPENIADLFAKYNVPKEPDFVTIDIDSCDLFVFKALVKRYRPRLITVEYNSNYPLGISMTNRCVSNGESYVWHGDNLFGASLSAIHKAAEESDYAVIYVEIVKDVFLLRKDLIVKGTEVDLGIFRDKTGIPVHRAATLAESQKWVEFY